MPEVSRGFHFRQAAPKLRLAQKRNAAKSPPHKGKRTGTRHTEKNQCLGLGKWGGGGVGTRKWLEEPRGVDNKQRREFYTQMNHMIYVGRMKREYVRREVPILTLFKPLFNSPVSSLFLKSRGEKMGTGVVFPGSCHVYAFKVDVPRGQSQKKVKSYS